MKALIKSKIKKENLKIQYFKIYFHAYFFVSTSLFKFSAYNSPYQRKNQFLNHFWSFYENPY